MMILPEDLTRTYRNQRLQEAARGRTARQLRASRRTRRVAAGDLRSAGDQP